MSVSIIMPMFNSGQFIKNAIRTVCLQTYEDWELIVVDDCSTDNSADVVKKLAESESRIKIVSLNKNGGPAIARNAGIEVSSGRYIAFLDSDDQWASLKLEKQVKFMQEQNIAFSHTGYKRVDSTSGKVLSQYIPPQHLSYKDMLYSNKIGCLTAMFDSSLIGRLTMPDIRKRQDYAMWLKILREVDFVYGIDEVLASYTVRNDSISSDKLALLKYNYSVFRNIEKFSFKC